jgi:DDE_Tnp_1-associated
MRALLEILFVALAAVLCGAKSCTDMSDFGRRKIDLLRRFVPLEKGVPSHDVFSDVFRNAAMRDDPPLQAVVGRLGGSRIAVDHREYEVGGARRELLPGRRAAGLGLPPSASMPSLAKLSRSPCGTPLIGRAPLQRAPFLIKRPPCPFSEGTFPIREAPCQSQPMKTPLGAPLCYVEDAHLQLF